MSTLTAIFDSSNDAQTRAEFQNLKSYRERVEKAENPDLKSPEVIGYLNHLKGIVAKLSKKNKNIGHFLIVEFAKLTNKNLDIALEAARVAWCEAMEENTSQAAAASYILMAYQLFIAKSDTKQKAEANGEKRPAHDKTDEGIEAANRLEAIRIVQDIFEASPPESFERELSRSIYGTFAQKMEKFNSGRAQQMRQYLDAPTLAA